MSPINARSTERWGAIVGTFAAAILLSMLPYTGWLKFAAPHWVTLALFYWCLTTPQQVGVGFGWGMGLLLDLLRGALFGQQALSKALLALLLVGNHRHLRLYSLWQQCLAVGVLCCVDLAIQLSVYRLTQGIEIRLLYFAGPVVTALSWPFVFALLRRL